MFERYVILIIVVVNKRIISTKPGWVVALGDNNINISVNIKSLLILII